MRICLLAALLAAGPAAAQAPAPAPAPAPALAPAQKPVDVGPNTPASNNAYQGGGVVLQGAPGAPPPTPQATPTGQAPSGAVKQ